MKASTRRLTAFAGGCLAGIGLGALAGIFNSYMEMIMLHVAGGYQDDSHSLWLACLVIGIGLGAAFAAMIPESPASDRSERRDEVSA
jgi:hypothetical protein